MNPVSEPPILALGEALVEFMPPIRETMRQAHQWQKFAGGGPATYAAACVRLGHAASLLSLVGKDPFSDFMLDALQQEGVDTAQIGRRTDRQIGLCYHECIEGETSLIFHRHDSAATTLSPSDIDPDLIAHAAALHVPGTTMQISHSALETSLQAMRWASQANVPVSFDPNIRAILGGTETSQAMEEGLAIADVVTPTLEEATAITGCGEPLQAARELQARGASFVAVTLASKGCVLLRQGEQTPIRCPGFAVDIVEPTGAGDVHAAAIMVGFLNDWETERIGQFANAAGALAVTAMGHFGHALPTLERIRKLIEDGGC
jgi:2-dehydro-3-deoxygluconokinase